VSNRLMSAVGGSRQRIGGLAVAALAFVLPLTRPAAAAPVGSPVTLTWEAPAGCPTVEQFTGALDRTLARTGATAAHRSGPAGRAGGAHRAPDVRGSTHPRRGLSGARRGRSAARSGSRSFST